MADIPVPDTVKVEMVYTLSGRRLQNVYHVRFPFPASPADLEALADQMEAWHADYQRAIHTPGMELDLIDLTALDAPGSAVLTRPVTVARAGVLAGGQTVPLNSALCLKWSTGLSGRSYRGRTYHCGYTSAQLDGWTRLSQAHVTDVVGRYQQLLNYVGQAGGLLVVASKYSGIDTDGRPIPRAQGITTVIDTVSADTRLDSMRRRLGPA